MINEWQDPMVWRLNANCQGVDPDLFFPERGEPTYQAKEVCRGCAVQVECLEYALQRRERQGIWGGTTDKERQNIIARRRARAGLRPHDRPRVLP